jgi:hypothetical protein
MGLLAALAGPGRAFDLADVERSAGAADAVGRPLAPRAPCGLDIHHIATGRGNSTLVVAPDGTTILIDAGATADGLDVSAAPRPDASRRPGEWIARYVERRLRAEGRHGLDAAVITHLHPDHLGEVTDTSPRAANGPYLLTGITDVAEQVPIGLLVDRGFPDYAYPQPWNAQFATNYEAFVRERVRRGERVERIAVGHADQFGLARPELASVPFEMRTIAANGQVWTGQGVVTRSLFPPLDGLRREDWPNENMCSIGLRIRFGRFAYFTGGDLTSYTFDGTLPWHDVLGPAAHASGPVDVATADHHGLFDGLDADVVRTLRPQAWVVPTWHLSHPDTLQLERMLSERLYAGPRQVFATNVMPGNLLSNARLMRRLVSTEGHVIVRVAPDSRSFTVVVTYDTDEGDIVRVVQGPMSCRAGPALETT